MFKKSLMFAAAIAANTVCTTQAEAATPTKFVKFEKLCASGTTCSMDVPVPNGTRGTHAMPQLSCTWNGAPVTRVDVVIALRSNKAQQFVIPTLLTDAEIAAAIWSLGPNYASFQIALAEYVAVTLYSDAFNQTTVSCYGAF